MSRHFRTIYLQTNNCESKWSSEWTQTYYTGRSNLISSSVFIQHHENIPRLGVPAVFIWWTLLHTRETNKCHEPTPNKTQQDNHQTDFQKHFKDFVRHDNPDFCERGIMGKACMLITHSQPVAVVSWCVSSESWLWCALLTMPPCKSAKNMKNVLWHYGFPYEK